MPDTGTYTTIPGLSELPPLVKRQRSLEAKLVVLAPLVDDEKSVRQQIDRLLVAAGIVPGDAITCNGYDVLHNVRAGSSRLNPIIVRAQLIAKGVEPAVVEDVIASSTETGEPSTWATVKPSKGSKVRRP